MITKKEDRNREWRVNMKKFYFSLGTVLNYKEQVLGNLKNEHAQCLQKVSEQERVVENLIADSKKTAAQLEEATLSGKNISFIRHIGMYLGSMEEKIQEESERLLHYRQEESKKRAEMIVAKQEHSSLEKLKEKKWEQYQVEVQKKEEQFIEEFVMNQRMIFR